MHATLRPYATAGIAIVGASLIAVTPVVAPLPALPDVQSRAVQLTGAWEEVFNAASENASTLMNNWYLAPGVGMQQFMANQSDYWDQLLNDPAGSSAGIAEQIQAHLEAVVSSFTDSSMQYHTLTGQTPFDDGHILMFGQIPGYLPADVDADQIMPIINWLASPQSAIFMGAIGPAISPWIALMNSVNDGDSFGDTLTEMSGAYFNGATLNLDSLLPMINDAGFFPTGMSMEHLDFAFGGLLSPGAVAVGPYQVLGDGGEVVASVPAVGGSLFNSVGLNFTGVPVLDNLDIASHGIGPIAAWQAWGQTVGAILGSGWDGKGEVVVTPPLVGVDLPTLPTDLLDEGGISDMAAESLSWLQDLFAF